MSTRVLTLFGEEIVPEQLNAVGKSRAVKKTEPEEQPQPEEKKERKPRKAKAEMPHPDEAAETTPKKDILDGWDDKKQYYAIGEVAALFQVNTSNIRFWTKEFNLKVRTTRKGDRLYTPEQVREIRSIYHLVKEKRYTISGARERLKTQKKVSEQTLDLRNSLLQLRNRLLTIRNQLT